MRGIQTLSVSSHRAYEKVVSPFRGFPWVREKNYAGQGWVSGTLPAGMF